MTERKPSHATLVGRAFAERQKAERKVKLLYSRLKEHEQRAVDATTAAGARSLEFQESIKQAEHARDRAEATFDTLTRGEPTDGDAE